MTLKNAMKFLKESKSVVNEEFDNQAIKNNLVKMPLEKAVNYLNKLTGKDFKVVSKNTDTFNGKKVMKLEADEGNYVLVIVQTLDDGQPIEDVNKVHLSDPFDEAKIEESLQDDKTIEDPHESECVKELTSVKTAKLESLQDDKTIEEPHESEAVKELTSVKFANPEVNKGEKPKEMNLGNKSKELNDNDPSLNKPYESETLKGFGAAVKKKKLESKEIKTEDKQLTELRHVEKKVIVKGYDFSELDKKIQERMVDNYNRRNNRGSDKDTAIKDAKQDAEKEFNDRIISETIFSNPSCYFSLPEGIDYPKAGGTLGELCPILSKNLKINEEDSYYHDNKFDGYIGDPTWRENEVQNVVLKYLKNYTNYRELEKAEKKEILSKIIGDAEKCKTIAKEVSDKFLATVEEIKKGSEDSFEKVNKKVIEELSKYWYTEDGDKIIDKANAKVVSGEVSESLLKESPVDLEFDKGYDVYSYDDLSDYAKNKAFASTERSRRNAYEERLEELEKRIMDASLPVFEKAGLKVVENFKGPNYRSTTGVYSHDKGQVNYVLYVLDPESLNEYAKTNGFDLGGDKFTYGSVSVRNNSSSYSSWYLDRNFHFENANYFDEIPSYKELKEEIEMDLEALVSIVPRVEKQFKKEIDDEFRNKLSTDKKLKRREYDSNGNVYRGKKDEQ